MRVIRFFLLTMALLFATPAFSQRDIQLNLQNADLREFVETVAKITGKNFVMGQNVQGSVTVISPEKFDKQALYNIFLSVLAVNGYSAVTGSGGVIKIIPSADTQFNGYDAVTRVYRLRSVGAAQALATLKPLMPAGNQLSADEKNNLLIISGQAADVERAVTVMAQIDRGATQQHLEQGIDVVRLRNASASDIARTLGALLSAEGKTQNKIVADERTNSILLQADPSEKLRLRSLIAHLDTPIENAGNTEVIYLKNARATAVAETLRQSKNALSVAENGQTVNLTNQHQQDGDVDIRADEATNALIITAPPATMRNLKQVIAKLDIRRAQVLVEAVIAEVSANDVRNLGVQWYAAGSSGTVPVGLIDFNNAGSSLLGMAAGFYQQRNGGGLSVDRNGRPTAVSSGATFGLGNQHVGMLINALNTLTDSNILSTPSLLVMDNQQAEFLVGENIPYVTGSYTTNSNGSSNPFQTVERQDVGVKLNIKPQISEGDTISLEIYQEVSNVLSVDAQQGPTTAKRSLKTTVLVENDQVLVLGGLMDRQQSADTQKVPLLGDIPVMGNLFKSNSKNDKKRNLMIFIRPQILRTRQSANFATQEKYDHLRMAQLAHPVASGDAILPARDFNNPPQNQPAALPAQQASAPQQETPRARPAPIYERSQPLTRSRSYSRQAKM